MAKSPEMEKFLNEAAMRIFGRERNDFQCVSCGSEKVGKPEFFKNDVSWEEWKISKMCQACQDSVWGDDDAYMTRNDYFVTAKAISDDDA